MLENCLSIKYLSFCLSGGFEEWETLIICRFQLDAKNWGNYDVRTQTELNLLSCNISYGIECYDYLLTFDVKSNYWRQYEILSEKST